MKTILSSFVALALMIGLTPAAFASSKTAKIQVTKAAAARAEAVPNAIPVGKRPTYLRTRTNGHRYFRKG
jgi:hypothetical protein